MKKEEREQLRKEWANKAQYTYPFGITMANLAIQNYIHHLEDELHKLKQPLITDSGMSVHILKKGKVKTICGINTNKVKGISYVQHAFEFTGNKENLCKECLSHFL